VLDKPRDGLQHDRGLVHFAITSVNQEDAVVLTMVYLVMLARRPA